MLKEKKFFLPKAMPAWLEIPLAALLVLGLIVLVLTMRNSNRWQDLFFPALIVGILLLIITYRLIYFRWVEKTLLEERNRLFHGILRSTSDGILAVSQDNKVLFANERFVEMWMIPQEVMALNDDSLLLQYVVDQLSDPKEFLQKVQELYNSAEESFDTLHFKDERVFDRLSRPMLQGTDVRGRVWSFRDTTERRQAEQRLLQAEENYRKLFENSLDGIFRSTPEGRFIMVNPALARIWAYDSPEDLLSRVADTARQVYVDPDGRAKHTRLLKEQGGTVTGYEYQAFRKDGSIVWVSESVRSVLDADGKLLYYEGTVEDITARKSAQEAVSRAEQRYRKLFEDSVEGIYQTTPDGKIVTINPAQARMLGYSCPEEMITNLKDINHQFYVDPARRGEFKRQVEEAGIAAGFESEVYCKDGRKIWISENARAVYSENGTVLYYEGTTFDVTERRQAEEAQRKAEENYRNFFENSIEGIIQTTPEGRINSANPAVAHILGYDSPQELIAMVTDLDHQLYVDPLHRAELKNQLEEYGRVSSFESEVYRKDGSKIWIMNNVLAVRDKYGQPLYYEGTLVDITARKQIERREQEAQQSQAAWISELERRTRQLSLLNEMSDLIQCCPTMEEAYSVISQQAQWIFPQESGILYVLGASGNLAESVAVWGDPPLDLITFNPTDCWAFRRGQLHGSETELTADPPYKQPVLICTHIQKPTPAAYICVPLIAQGETLGVLHLRHYSEKEYKAGISEVWYTEARKQLAHTVADSLALAISNLRLRDSLRQQSIRDPLTGMFNRRYMEESLDREVARAVRAGRPLGVIMVDIDHFKNFNDMYGHEAGDAVLRELGVFFRSQIREADIACRYGGEEFALIMPDASLEITRQRAEKIRGEVKQLQVKHRGRLLGSVSLSLGIAEIPRHGSTGEILIRAADAALYQAKKTGRDRVVIGRSQKNKVKA